MLSRLSSKIEIVFCLFLRETLVSSFMLLTVFFYFPFLWHFKFMGFLFKPIFAFKLCLWFSNLWVRKLQCQSLQSVLPWLFSLVTWVVFLFFSSCPQSVEQEGLHIYC